MLCIILVLSISIFFAVPMMMITAIIKPCIPSNTAAYFLDICNYSSWNATKKDSIIIWVLRVLFAIFDSYTWLTFGSIIMTALTMWMIYPAVSSVFLIKSIERFVKLFIINNYIQGTLNLSIFLFLW